MPASTSYPPLDLDATRTAVLAGKLVRVGILPTRQFPDGSSGRVRRVGDPDVDGPEFVEVEIAVGGAKDVIPFAPTDLSPLRRGQQAPEPVSATSPPRRGRQRRTVPEPSATAAFPLDLPSAAAATPERAPSIRSAPARPSRSAAARRSGASRTQPVSVLLATAEPDHTTWEISVKVGTKLVVKPTAVPAARAWALVSGIGNPDVERAVAQTLGQHRARVQQRADELASELQATQAELALYPDLP